MSRSLLAAALSLTLLGIAQAQKEPKGVTRYGLESDYEVFPQATPKELAASVVKAINRERFDYLAAHLMEPEFVDARLKRANLKIEDIGKEIKAKYQAQPEVLKDLVKLLNNGESEDTGTSVILKHKDVKNLQVYLKKIGDRWYVENRQKDAKE